ncbi:MAG: type VI secretion system baseplate subunit TssF [Ignavibacteriota bacterium]
MSFVDLTGSKKTPDRDNRHHAAHLHQRRVAVAPALRQREWRLRTGKRVDRSRASCRSPSLLRLCSRLSYTACSGAWFRRLSLNYLSLVAEGVDAFREILRLCTTLPNRSLPKSRSMGILSLKSEPHFARLTSTYGVTFARGTRVEMELDEEQFAGVGAYTFAAVMDVFLGLYTSMNSFSQLVVRTRQRKRVLKQWPATERDRKS